MLSRYFVQLALPLMVTASVQSQGLDKEAVITRMEMRSLATWHYNVPSFDDSMSEQVFALYLKRLDSQKRFLLQRDVDSLSRFKDSLDDQLKAGSYAFSEMANALLGRRIGETRVFVHDLLKAGLKLGEEDSLTTEPDKLAFCKTLEELKVRWVRVLKYQVLLRLQDHREEQVEKDSSEAAKAKKKAPAKNLPSIPDSAEIKDAVAYVSRNLDRGFARMIREEKLDRVSVYLNALANVMDPHTEYFKPEAREEFNLSMSGKLEGIGAVLREDDGYIKVVSIVPGSASWRQKDLKAEDKILKVAQGSEEPVDLVEASVQEAVRLIRGKKGTEVRLTVQKPNGQTKVISIIRDVVVVEEAYAKSAVLQSADAKQKFGYIALPSFYHDFMNPDGRNAADDVKRELEKLKAKSVSGILLDLRGNGGGALEDAVKMAGLFLPGGPVVQVKDRRGTENVLEDTDPTVTFAGPLILLVNTFSASASEILAAAMQDYGRALILGSDTTFGKGTVQTLVDLDNFASPAEADLKPLGTVKLTVQKFYRVNGGSTQFRGVVPEILLPDGYTYLDVGEKSLEHVMPWDTVKSLKIKKWPELPYKQLEANSQIRVAANPYFKRVDEFLKHQEIVRRRHTFPLKLTKFFEEQKRSRQESDALETLQKQATVLNVEPLGSDNAATAADSVEKEKVKSWKEALVRDEYLHEAVEVMNDMVATPPVKR